MGKPAKPGSIQKDLYQGVVKYPYVTKHHFKQASIREAFFFMIDATLIKFIYPYTKL